MDQRCSEDKCCSIQTLEINCLVLFYFWCKPKHLEDPDSSQGYFRCSRILVRLKRFRKPSRTLHCNHGQCLGFWAVDIYTYQNCYPLNKKVVRIWNLKIRRLSQFKVPLFMQSKVSLSYEAKLLYKEPSCIVQFNSTRVLLPSGIIEMCASWPGHRHCQRNSQQQFYLLIFSFHR